MTNNNTAPTIPHEGDGFYDVVEHVAPYTPQPLLQEPLTPDGVAPDPAFCEGDETPRLRWDNTLLRSERVRELDEQLRR